MRSISMHPHTTSPLRQSDAESDSVSSDEGREDIPMVDVSEEPTDLDEGGHVKFSFRKLWMFVGPGWLMSIAYLDPGNIESDLQAGVWAGYKLLWVLFWATAMGYVLQLMAARLGVVAGHDLAQVCRHEYPRPVALIVWLMTEIAIIGSDIQEVVGSAIAFQLLFGIPLWVGVLITAVDTFTFLLLERGGVRRLEALFASLIAVMAATFFAVMFMGGPDPLQMLEGVALPRVPARATVQAVGMLGAVIMPHNIYLHSALVRSRRINRSSRARLHEANYYFAVESAISLFVSFCINAAVVSVFAAVFYFPDEDHMCQGRNGSMIRCLDIGLEDAGYALEATLRTRAARYIWAIGLLAAGQSSTMTGTYAGQFVMDGFLNLRLPMWKRLALTRGLAIVPAIIVALLAQDKLNSLDEWLNVLQSLQLPFALLPVLKFASSEGWMGEFKNVPTLRVLGWLLFAIVMGANGYLLQETLDDLVGGGTMTWVLSVLFAIPYLAICGYLIHRPVRGHVHHDAKPLLQQEEATA